MGGPTPQARISNVIICAILFGFLGLFMQGPRQRPWLGLSIDRQIAVQAPYCVPIKKGGTSLRLAMVHDVLHERYLRHSREYYRARIDKHTAQKARSKASIDAGEKPSEGYLDGLDTLAVCHDKLGESDRAIELMNEKLALQQKHNPEAKKVWDHRKLSYESVAQKLALGFELSAEQEQLYRTYANLGTAQIHKHVKAAIMGQKSAKSGLRSGLENIKRAMAINPGAHFGRETWQVVIVQHILRSLDNPKLVQNYDGFGYPINAEEYYIYFESRRRQGLVEQPKMLSMLAGIDDVEAHDWSPAARAEIRDASNKVGQSKGWQDEVKSIVHEPVPFDEPVLGVLGMWTLGGGPNPHFSLILGNIMSHVGQNYISWKAYARTLKMVERYSKDPKTRELLTKFCKDRQMDIEQRIGRPKVVAGLQAEFEAELKHGLDYQRAYKDYERAQIKAGKDPEGKDFYSEFFKAKGQIASDPGDADWMVMHDPTGIYGLINHIPPLLFLMGLGSWLGLLLKSSRE